MVDVGSFRKFVGAANRAHQQLCVWFYLNNHFAKHQARWNKHNEPMVLFDPKKFERTNGCKYKNFWSVANASVQHGWILGAARLFDPAYSRQDKSRRNPRISLPLILENVHDKALVAKIEKERARYESVIRSVREHRHNALAHNDLNFSATNIEAGIEGLFQWLETVIYRIKKSEPHLADCGSIQVKYNNVLSKCGVDEVFETLLLGEVAEQST